MKQRNIIRFVSLRRPVQAGRKPVPVARHNEGPRSDDPNGPNLFSAIHALSSSGVATDPARARAAREFIGSHHYVFRNREWKPYLGLRPDLAAAIRDARAVAGGAVLFERIKEILNQVIEDSQTLAEFIDSLEFARLHESLWQSYFANLIVPDVRPMDRPVLVFWIRLFNLLLSLKSEESPGTQIDAFDRIRPAVPLDVVGRKPERRIETPASFDEEDTALRGEELAEANRDIARLRMVRNRIDRIVALRLEAIREQPVTVLNNEGGKLPTDPLTIHASDINESDKALLERHGIAAEGSHSTVTNAIDAVVASRLEHIEAIEAVTETVVVSGVLVRRRRPRAERFDATPEESY